MGSTVKEEQLRWFGRAIPYAIDHSVENLRKLIEGDTKTTGAIQILQEQTHLRFVVRSNQSDYICFVDGEACSSPYGRQGGRQEVRLNKDTCDRPATVIHEIAHAMGMRHEHSRRDRDRFVTVHWENIEDGKEHWFEKYGASEGTEYGAYDFSSIMHYGSCAFGRGGYYWTSGWTTAVAYTVGGAPYLFLLKVAGVGSDGNNVHIHALNTNGNVGARIASYKWTEGWTTAMVYTAGGAPFLFLLKAAGVGSDGNNVHIHALNANGSVGTRIASYKWTEGWTTAMAYTAGGAPYLFLLKAVGFGSHGNNVHIHALDQNGRVGDWAASNKWTQGWTTAIVYTAGGVPYLFLLKAAGFGRDGNNAHIHAFNKNGSVGARIASYKWTEGWTTGLTYTVGGAAYLFLLKAAGVGRDGNNVHIEKLGVNGMINGRATICPTLSFKSSADPTAYTGNPANLGGSTLTNTDLAALDSLPRGILHVHVLQSDGTLGRRRDTQHWTNGWTTGRTYTLAAQTYILFLKRMGTGTDGNNVHIHKFNSDGSVGDRVASYKWTHGWTTALTYTVGGASYLFLLKAWGFGNDGTNTHIHKLNSDGSVGDRVASYKWTTGWTTAMVYTVGGAPYLFLLKAAGFGSDGNSVHIHAINNNGSVGGRVASYKWTQGWTTAIIYMAGGAPYLFLLKAAGFGNDGNNVHIHAVNNNGSLGARVASYKWTEGWTTTIIYMAGGAPYLFLLKAAGFGSDGNNVHIHAINNNGSVGARGASYKWPEAWTSVGTYTIDTANYLFLLRSAYPT
ncbi:MAG TPA: M12 family metallopeptidase [Nitrospiraceae bacterium]|nr:M12 family metallopeptidase [Nitrospiraceae bacterium]